MSFCSPLILVLFRGTLVLDDLVFFPLLTCVCTRTPTPVYVCVHVQVAVD